ncbi:MAG: hypothetical protein ACRYHQ_40615 [Janthinobacterium lividum]
MHDGTVLPTWGVMVAATLQWIGKVHPIGETREQQGEAQANAMLFAASRTMSELLDEATRAWAEQFDGPEDQDCSVSGGDLVEWFAQWRVRARQALDVAGVP